MSYPALIENVDTGGPTGGADMPAAAGGGAVMVEAIGGTEGEAEGGKGELLVYGEERIEAGGYWEEREGGGARGLLKEAKEGGGARGLLKAGMEGTGGREVETEGEPMEMEPMPGWDRGLDRPET